MKRSILCWASALIIASGLALQARADTVNNTFDNPFSYAQNGIIGDSFWDGVYLKFGDITGGGVGGNGGGVSQTADTIFNAGFLTVTNVGGDWAGAGDDGFFLYRVVSGDFDVSVQVVNPFDNRANNFVGLLTRAYQTNNSGAPFSPSTTNSAENFLGVFRFNEFNLDGVIRVATNNTDLQYQIGNSADNNTDVSTPRYYRITRVGDVFSFYQKTNDVDSWIPLTNAAGLGGTNAINRPDLHGIAMQVGPAQASFSGTPRIALFDNFQLTSTNVTATPPTPPAPPSNVQMISSNVTGSATITWTPGTGADGSLVLIRANGRIISEPLQGYTYTPDTAFTNANTLLGAGNTHVVYVGSGNSVTVTGLGGTNNTYDIAVFSYAGTGSSIVYNRDAPATNQIIGPGQVAQVSFTLNPSQIPAGGAAVAQVTATYTSGDSYDVSSDLSTVWVSSDPTVAVAGNGVVTGITNGTTTITATYAGITGTNTATVVTPAFVDNFDTNENYLTNGVLGSTWDGVYLGAGDVPFQIAANLGAHPGVVSQIDANITTNNMLTLTHNQTGWEGNEDDGFFLFKYVPGDFQVAVHIESYDIRQFQIPGLMARLFAPGGGAAGTANTTFTHGRESHMRWARFDEFGITTCARRNQNGGTLFHDTTDGETSDYWLLMVRQGTTFTFYKRANPTDNWVAVPGSTQTMTGATNGAPMQVGIGASTFDSGTNFLHAAFSHFMLDAANLQVTGTPPSAASTPALVNNPDGTMTINWTPGAGSAGSLVVVRAAKVVNVKPTFGSTYTASATFGQGSDLGSGNFVVYAGTGNSVTVSGLVPGTTYYAAVFSYSGTGATTSYNTFDTRQTSTLVLGVVQTLTVTLPQGNQLLNGGVLPFKTVANYVGGVSNDVTSQVTLSANPVGWVAGTNAFLTGLTNGPVSVSVTFQSVTTNVSVTVFSPHLTDDFSVPHDYLANGVPGSIWDGVYFGSTGSYPNNSVPGNTGSGQTLTANASITTNGVLIVQSQNNSWAGTGDDGFLLWHYAAGDFQTSVQVASIDKDATGNGSIGFDFSGLMARAYGNTNDMSGAPYNGAENWIYFGEFEQFGDSTESRHALNGNDNELPLGDGATNDFYMLMRRQGGTFTFFRRVNPTDPWTFLPNQTIVRADLAAVPMQVGLFQAMYTPSIGTVAFANFMLNDAPPALNTSSGVGSMNINWPAIPLLQLQSAGDITSATWPAVPGLPGGVTNGVETLTVPTATGTNQFFRLSR